MVTSNKNLVVPVGPGERRWTVLHPAHVNDTRSTPEAYLGTWRIREIGERTPKVNVLVGHAKIAFDKDGLGSIRFMSTQANLDCRFMDRAGEVFAEFSGPQNDGDDGLVCRERNGAAPGRGMACRAKVAPQQTARDFGA